MQQNVIRTTLRDLIAAVTDEVKPFVRDPSDVYIVVSWVLSDLLAHQRVDKRLQEKSADFSCKANSKQRFRYFAERMIEFGVRDAPISRLQRTDESITRRKGENRRSETEK
jgi:hypothetical protein